MEMIRNNRIFEYLCFFYFLLTIVFAVCLPSSIYDFWFPLMYFRTFLYLPLTSYIFVSCSICLNSPTWYQKPLTRYHGHKNVEYTFRIHAPKLSNQNKVFIWCDVLIGYFFQYEYNCYARKSINIFYTTRIDWPHGEGQKQLTSESIFETINIQQI